MTSRQQRLVFGEVAGEYDAVRPGYPDALLEVVLDYAGGRPARAVEVGAGTGLATRLFAPACGALTCVEPDPEMAAVLSARFAGTEVRVEVSGFEQWRPPAGGVDLLYAAQSWHWVDPVRRWDLAHDALAPGGVIALFGHRYEVADEAIRADLDDVYRRLAPSIADDAAFPVRPYGFDIERATDLRREELVWTVPTSTRDYLRLLATFSSHRMLDDDVRERLWAGIGEVIDVHGGVVGQQITTGLSLGRRGD